MHIQGGEIFMKLLKIENNEGYYLIEGESYGKIDQITKEDILRLMNFIYENDKIAFDNLEDRGDKKINLPSQLIVYEKLHEKFLDLYDKKEEIIKQVDSKFQKAVEKYQVSSE